MYQLVFDKIGRVSKRLCTNITIIWSPGPDFAGGAGANVNYSLKQWIT